MVNVTVTTIADPMRDLALSYAPADRRRALHTLFALDAALGDVLRTTREPMVGQMRLAWWREALAQLDSAPAPPEPILKGLVDDVMPFGVTGAALSAMVDGWEPLLGSIGDAVIADHGRLRGTVLFTQAGAVLGTAPADPIAEGGRGWALADLHAHLSDPALAIRAREAAMPPLTSAMQLRWSRNGRALGALVHNARMEMGGPAKPWRVARLAWHRLTGR